MRSTLSTPSVRTVRRVIAVTLTILFALTFSTSAFAVADTGGDHGACSDGLWLKADWNGEGWDWEAGPDWDGDAPTAPALTVTSWDDGDPMTVAWTSDTYVLQASVKASTEYASSSGGYAGTVTGIDGHAISHIVFCYGPEPVLVPSIGLEKTPDVTTITYDPDDGDEETITYTYLITNTGDTPLTGITLVDDVLGPITLTDTDLAVGASMTVTATHVVTAADAQEGQVLNTAVTTGTAPDETEVDATDSATVLVELVAPTVVLDPEITLEKTALVTPDQDGRKVVTWSEAAPTGTEVTYEYVITNTGETPLTAITLVDDVLGTITLTDTDLAVGESMTVTAVHSVTGADADAGSITNEATTTATDPEGTEVTDAAVETVLVAEVQSEVVDKDTEPSVVDEETEPSVVDEEEAEPSVLAEKEEQLPVTGAATTVLAVLAALSLATGAGLLRRYPGRP